MIYPAIRIEGAILSPDILSQIEDSPGQKPSDFGFESKIKVKDEIARAWADSQDYWRIFQRKVEALKPGSNATTETRNLWMVPLLGLLRYDIEYQARGIELNERVYAISHRATNRADTSIQIIGYNDPAGLDKKPANASRRMSAHALVQEFLNLHDQLYGIVTNGHVIRLLRDSSRLVKQSYLEFDLDRIFNDGLFADFAILFRLLHATRLPLTNDLAPESLIERYHQDSLESGARIRDGLSKAVKFAIGTFANGFINHPHNEALRAAITNHELSPTEYYASLLRLIYRLLFLMVIEERDLIFPPDTPGDKRDIYRHHYSIARLRALSEKRYLADSRYQDLWLAMLTNFSLFSASGPGMQLGIAPLAGDLFGREALGMMSDCLLSNQVVLNCLRSLSLYRHPETDQLIRVNYAGLNVEEFGSVYEGLLEFDPEFLDDGTGLRFNLRKGDDRAVTGSHYTPDDLVQPLIQHSLEHLIAERKKAENPEAALLGLRVADIACGSGHILLAAARRIAMELAIIRTQEEQPSPSAYRSALRDTIRSCIYGVDLNPLAVELCKVAMWLEAHIPGQPLNFLDHHIKCGNAIVGYARREDVGRGVPDEAFKTLVGDDKDITKEVRKRNKDERSKRKQTNIEFTAGTKSRMDAILAAWKSISNLPEHTPQEIRDKKQKFAEFTAGKNAWLLNQVASIPIAQFYIPKTRETETTLITDGEFSRYWRGEQTPQGKATATALAISHRKRFFHWFLEFPEVMEAGGFDCILGNPPYLGRKHLSGTYGYQFCELMRWEFAPTGLSDLVVFFLRRISQLVRVGGFSSIITTNSITDGDIRSDGLDQIIISGYQINMAVRGVKWPGAANLVVSLLSVFNGIFSGQRFLDSVQVDMINSFFEAGEVTPNPSSLLENKKKIFQGSIFLGDGFLLNKEEADRLYAMNSENMDVIRPIINGKELNNDPHQKPGRLVINFQDWTLEQSMKYEEPFSIVEELVKPERMKSKRAIRKNRWWQHAERATALYSGISDLNICFATVWVTKHLSFSVQPTDIIFTNSCYIFVTERWDLFSVVQSTLHEVWARKYSGSLETRLRYSPTDCFETFPFPGNIWESNDEELTLIGDTYHSHRKALMLSLSLGLTKLYNLFHAKELSPEMIEKVSKTDADTSESGYSDLKFLREMHAGLDNRVKEMYGWNDLDLAHDFYEVETLPENDRVRYTISPEARKEVLKRLLALNHERHAEMMDLVEEEKQKYQKTPLKKKSKIVADPGQSDMFSGTQITHANLGAKSTSKQQTDSIDESWPKVSHPKFGEGYVINTEGAGDAAKLTIKFDSGEKNLLAKYLTFLK